QDAEPGAGWVPGGAGGHLLRDPAGVGGAQQLLDGPDVLRLRVPDPRGHGAHLGTGDRLDDLLGHRHVHRQLPAPGHRCRLHLRLPARPQPGRPGAPHVGGPRTDPAAGVPAPRHPGRPPRADAGGAMTVHSGFTKVSLDAFEGVAEEPGVAKPDPIMVADSVTRRFGGLTAVRVDHFEIQREAITALIGPNGAGKTTFFNLITGFDKPNAGHWSFEDE